MVVIIYYLVSFQLYFTIIHFNSAMSIPTHSGNMSENMYYEASNPLDLEGARISQTPAQALSHIHFKLGYVVNIICCFGINALIALLLLGSSDRIGFKVAYEKVLQDNVIYKYVGTSIIVDLLIALPLVVLFSVWLGDFTVRSDVAKGKALPVPTRDLRPFRFFGVTLTNVALRIVVMMVWIMITVFPFVFGMMTLSCSNGTMDSYTGPETENVAQCFIKTGSYIWYKGLICGFACAVFAPFVELAGLNRMNINDTEYNSFLGKHFTTLPFI